MKREPLIINPPENCPEHDKRNFARHFQDRFKVEEKAFGHITPEDVFQNVPTLYCDDKNLNSEHTVEFIRSQKPDLSFIFGVNLLKRNIIQALPHDKINLHLGLSPWYKGSATLFWPFYNLEPQFAGSTFHQNVESADAGPMIHQCVPELKTGDGIHDVGVRSVLQATDEVIKLLSYREKVGPFIEHPQKSVGRLYLSTQFRPQHLRPIYDLFDNKIVDAYLEGQLGIHKPALVQAKFNF